MENFLGLKKFRERNKMKASLLAEELGVSNATYNNWEKGKRDPSFGFVKRLFEMGATVEELFDVDYENNMLQNSEKYKNSLVTLARLEKVIAGNENESERDREYAEEYTKMIKAKYKILRLDKEMKQTSNKAENEAKMQEFDNAVKSRDSSNRRIQELRMQDLKEEMKAENYSKASQIRTMISSKAANSYENEFPELSSYDIGIW